jgi:hypothetical protein
MSHCEITQDGTAFHVQLNGGPWFPRYSSVNDCTASSTIVCTFAEYGLGELLRQQSLLLLGASGRAVRVPMTIRSGIFVRIGVAGLGYGSADNTSFVVSTGDLWRSEDCYFSENAATKGTATAITNSLSEIQASYWIFALDTFVYHGVLTTTGRYVSRRRDAPQNRSCRLERSRSPHDRQSLRRTRAVKSLIGIPGGVRPF